MFLMITKKEDTTTQGNDAKECGKYSRGLPRRMIK